MGTSSVVVIYVLNYYPSQMSSIKNQEQIEAFFASRANPTFRKRVCIGGSDRGLDDMKAFGLENSLKSLAE